MHCKEVLSHEINTLRQQLHSLMINKDQYHTKHLVSLSVELDNKIIEYMLLNAHEE